MIVFRIRVAAALVAVAVLALVAGGYAWKQFAGSGTPASPAPSALAVAGHYVDNTQCLGCHADQAAQWQQSHHAMAMAAPTAQSVRGDFNNTAFTHQGVTTRFFLRDGKYFVNTDGPDGKPADFPVAYTFGVAPLQQYLLALPGGRLQALQVAWDTERKRWFHLLPNERTPPGDVLHWTGRYQTANTMCLSCHTTGFEKQYDAASDTFASTWHEPNVSCQSCHGPGQTHVAWAQARQQGQDGPDIGGTHYGLGVDAAMLAGQQQVEVCAACHSRRSELTAAPTPGAPRYDHYLPALLTEGLYHADGQQLDEVFVDGSFRQSRMYAKGVTCTDCHNPHTGKLKLAGNAVCMQCHATPGNPAFPTAPRVEDSPAHTFHAAGTPGAQCTACHMPAKTYMQVQARPDHAIRVPRPDLSVKLGTPDACTQCHADRGAQWAADRVAQWYGPGRRQEAHYGEVFAAARAGRPESAPALAQLAADLQQPAIVRATALDALRGDGAAGMDVRINATRDPDPGVRAAAATSFDAAPAARRAYALAPLLGDPVRAVRIAAAASLASLPRSQIATDQWPALDRALAEYIAAQQVSLDMPGARLNLGVVYTHTGQDALAEQHYLAALKIDPDFTPARANLATFYNGRQRNAEAERVLRDGLERNPGIGELQYSLGLLLAEEGRLADAADALARASALMPDRARVHYNLGLALQQLGRRKTAEAALLKAHATDAADAAVVYALVVFYAQGKQQAPAMHWVGVLERLAQTDPAARQLFQNLQGGP